MWDHQEPGACLRALTTGRPKKQMPRMPELLSMDYLHRGVSTPGGRNRDQAILGELCLTPCRPGRGTVTQFPQLHQRVQSEKATQRGRQSSP